LKTTRIPRAAVEHYRVLAGRDDLDDGMAGGGLGDLHVRGVDALVLKALKQPRRVPAHSPEVMRGRAGAGQGY